MRYAVGVTELTASELARALAAQRRRLPKTCAVCGREFVGMTKSRYCSNACRVHAYQERKRPELNARRRERYREQPRGT